MIRRPRKSDGSSSRSEQPAEDTMEEKSRRPKDTPFRQQRVKSWLPILQPYLVVCIFFTIGVVFIPLGKWFNDESDQVVEYVVKYDGDDTDVSGCEISSYNASATCTITIAIDEYVEPPTYVYYELENYYQNHRRYVKSRNSYQLLGETTDTSQFCDPLQEIEKDGETLSLNPCGLIANSMFNDTITLVEPPNSYNGSAGDTFMSEEGISWESDREVRFKQPPGFTYVEVGSSSSCLSLDSSCLACLGGDSSQYSDCQNYTDESSGKEYKFWYPDDDSTQYLYETYPDIVSPIEGVLNEHFIVWMRTAGLPRFRKLYAIISEPLEVGDELKFNITAHFDVSEFSGGKSLVVSNVSLMGARNPYLGIAYISLGSLSLAIGVAFFIMHRMNPRKLGDTKFLVWKDTAM